MRKRELYISYLQCDNINELESHDKDLLMAAKKSVNDAYAPYSQYYVGSAVQLEDGKIICGNNQENIAYPSGLCAERIALFYTSSRYPDQKICAIAITAKADNFEVTEPVAPCGACRQVLAEYQTKQQHPIKIILMGETGKIKLISSVDDILPFMFHAEQLKK